ncbi:unnamed protein product [Lathyrus oleraceus]
MDQLKQENQELWEEVNTLKANVERLSNMMEALVAAQNHPSPNSQETIQRIMISGILSTPISMAPLSAPRYHMPSGFPWGMPPNYIPEGYRPHVTKALVVTTVMFVPHLVVHTTPYNEELIFHTAPSEVVVMDEKMDKFQD